MKLVSFNIGNFIFVKNRFGRKHYGFDVRDMDEVKKLIGTENPDILFLQEIESDEDLEFILKNFPQLKNYKKVRNDDGHSFAAFLSRYDIEEIPHTSSNDYIINGVNFFPVHLDWISPKERMKQVSKILQDVTHNKTVIMGDTNFWIFNNFFFSRTDKKSYKIITKEFRDILGSNKPTSRALLTLDKVFLTKDLNYKKAHIVKHKINWIDHYMLACELQ